MQLLHLQKPHYRKMSPTYMVVEKELKNKGKLWIRELELQHLAKREISRPEEVE